MNILTSERTITEAFRLLAVPAAVHGPQSAAAARTKCRVSGDLADADLAYFTSGQTASPELPQVYASGLCVTVYASALFVRRDWDFEQAACFTSPI